MEQAIYDVVSSDTLSIRPTAHAWNVPLSTLSRRAHGGLTRREAHASQQLLSSTQEKMLVNWILEQELLGHAPIHQRVCEFAA